MSRVIAAAADPDALAEVYHAYSETVYRLAYRITHSAADASDVTQDIFIGLPEALGMLRTDSVSGFEAWLKTVTTRAALKKLRTRKRRAEVTLGGAVSFLRSRRESILERIALDRALELLPESQRTVFVLKEIEGFSHKEIADSLGISPRASEVRLFRAKRRLWHLLGDD